MEIDVLTKDDVKTRVRVKILMDSKRVISGHTYFPVRYDNPNEVIKIIVNDFNKGAFLTLNNTTIQDGNLSDSENSTCFVNLAKVEAIIISTVETK